MRYSKNGETTLAHCCLQLGGENEEKKMFPLSLTYIWERRKEKTKQKIFIFPLLEL